MDEATHKKNFKPIIIRDLFMDKNPRLARWIPGFIYRLLSRILRIDFMNDPILYNHGYKKDVDFARASIEAFNVTLEVLVNDLLTNVKNMDGIFVPINKHGAQAVENVRRINAIFESDQQVISFPAGLVSRKKKGVIRDVPWQISGSFWESRPTWKCFSCPMSPISTETNILSLPLGNRFPIKLLINVLPH